MPETAELNRAAAVKGITGSFGGISRINGRETPPFYAFFHRNRRFSCIFLQKRIDKFYFLGVR